MSRESGAIQYFLESHSERILCFKVEVESVIFISGTICHRENLGKLLL